MDIVSENMHPPNVTGFASFIRNLEDECTILRIIGKSLVAGSASGKVASWKIGNGSKNWEIDFAGPCLQSDSDGKRLFISESNNLHAIDSNNGNLLWSISLEGSCDFLRWSNGFLWMTSSVFNSEIHDYTHAEIWLFDGSGSLINSWNLECRAWSLAVNQDTAIVGLSRPRCGYATISNAEGLDYKGLNVKYPVTTGSDYIGGTVIFGHSNGEITEVSNEGASSFKTGDSSVRSLFFNKGWIAGMESGKVRSSEELGSWEINVEGIVDLIMAEQPIEGEMTAWICSSADDSKLTLVDVGSGEVKFQLSCENRIRIGHSSRGLLAFGDSEGRVFFFESDVVYRRFEEESDDFDVLEKRNELRKKIRRLRGG